MIIDEPAPELAAHAPGSAHQAEPRDAPAPAQAAEAAAPNAGGDERIEPVLGAAPDPSMDQSAATAAVAARAEAAEAAGTALPGTGAAAIDAAGGEVADDDADGIIIDLAPEPPPELALDLSPPLPMSDIDEPGFIKRSREQEQAQRRRRLVMAVGSVLLLATALGQTVRNFRNELAVQLPPLRPALVLACQALACRVELPMQIAQLSIEVGELQMLPGGLASLTTALRNRSSLAQAWPHIDLVLIDGADKPLARRVVTPGEYLPAGTDMVRGFGARSEQNIKLYFDINQVKASGYKVSVFFP
jgi:hypothetical protein